MKYHLTLLFFCFSCSLIYAQLSVGLQVETGESWQYYGEQTEINGFDQRISHYGFSAALFYAISPKISVGVKPAYMRRGAACFPGFAGIEQPVVQDATIYANYVQLPLLAQMNFPVTNRFSVFAEAGGGFSYLLDGHWQLLLFDNLEGNAERRDIDFESDTFLNRYDFAAQGSLGFAYQMGPGQVQLAGGYYHGFLDVNDNNTSENRTWSLSLGYQYTLGVNR